MMQTTITLPKQQGFTLLELMVTLTVLAVVLGIGLPAFRDSIARSNVVAESNKLLSSLNFARSQAVAKGQVVTVERQGSTSQNWSAGWTVFTDAGGQGNQAFNAGDGDTVLQTSAPNASQILIRANAAAADQLSFNASGRIIANGGDIQLTICDSDLSTVVPGRQIDINLVGRTSVSTLTTCSSAP